MHSRQLLGNGIRTICNRPRTMAAAALLLAGLACIGEARADVVSLSGVTFADGGTAAGSFSLNLSNYVSGVSIVTSGGALAGETYGGNPQGLQVPAPPLSASFDFYTAQFGWDLHLALNSPITNGSIGLDALIAGGGTFANPTGSYEDCSNAAACGAPAGTIRFVTAGGVQVPEPGGLAILGLAAAGLAYSWTRTQSLMKLASPLAWKSRRSASRS